MSGGAFTDMKATEIASQDVNFFNGSYAGALPGVKLTYSGGAACPLTGAQTQLSINIFCDALTPLDYNPVANTENPCAPVVTIISQLGCPRMSVSMVWVYLGAYEAYFGVALIGIGVVFCFFGIKVIGFTICIVGLLTCIAASCLIFYAVYASSATDPKEFLYWVGGGVIAGVIFGCILCKKQKCGASLLAGWGGAMLGTLVNEMFLYRLGYSWTTYAAIFAGAAAGGMLVSKYYEPIIIGSTALVGSYAIIRGVSCYLGHYYNEFEMANMVKNGLIADIDPYYWGYIGAFVIFAVIGYKVQQNLLKKMKAKEAKKRKKKSQKKNRVN
jgi:hypothetical protein